MVHYPVAHANRANARRMRHAMTDTELKLWNVLRAHRLNGLGFRRQLPVARFIVDFACPTNRLIVELDGSQHGDVPVARHDDERTQQLEALGWAVLRFWNDAVLTDIEGSADIS